MKKAVVCILLMICALPAGAQWSVTPEVGLMAVKRIDPISSSDWQAGAKIGAAMEYDFTQRFALRAGLYYAPRTYSFNGVGGYYNYYNDGGYNFYPSTYYMEGRQISHYLHIPVMAVFSWQLSDMVRWRLGVGPTIGFSMANSWKSSYNRYSGHYGYEHGYGSYYGYDYGYSHGRYRGSNQFKHFEWGVGLMTGVDINNWVVNAGFDIAFPTEYSGANFDTKFYTVSLSVGYKFSFGK